MCQYIKLEQNNSEVYLDKIHKKPSEIELERIIMHAACVAKTKQYDTVQMTSESEIEKLFQVSCDELKVTPDKDQIRIAKLSIQALLLEGNFLNEIIEFRSTNPNQPPPAEFRSKMQTAIEKSVNEFIQDQNL